MAKSSKNRFPGFERCMAMIRQNRDPQMAEDGFWYLFSRAEEFVDELIYEFHSETELSIKRWLLDLIGNAKAPQALNLFVEYATSEDEALKNYALEGLRHLDTKEARTVLFELGENPLTARTKHHNR